MSSQKSGPCVSLLQRLPRASEPENRINTIFRHQTNAGPISAPDFFRGGGFPYPQDCKRYLPTVWLMFIANIHSEIYHALILGYITSVCIFLTSVCFQHPYIHTLQGRGSNPKDLPKIPLIISPTVTI